MRISKYKINHRGQSRHYNPKTNTVLEFRPQRQDVGSAATCQGNNEQSYCDSVTNKVYEAIEEYTVPAASYQSMHPNDVFSCSDLEHIYKQFSDNFNAFYAKYPKEDGRRKHDVTQRLRSNFVCAYFEVDEVRFLVFEIIHKMPTQQDPNVHDDLFDNLMQVNHEPISNFIWHHKYNNHFREMTNKVYFCVDNQNQKPPQYKDPLEISRVEDLPNPLFTKHITEMSKTFQETYNLLKNAEDERAVMLNLFYWYNYRRTNHDIKYSDKRHSFSYEMHYQDGDYNKSYDELDNPENNSFYNKIVYIMATHSKAKTEYLSFNDYRNTLYIDLEPDRTNEVRTLETWNAEYKARCNRWLK